MCVGSCACVYVCVGLYEYLYVCVRACVCMGVCVCERKADVSTLSSCWQVEEEGELPRSFLIAQTAVQKACGAVLGGQVGQYMLTCHVNYTGGDGERRYDPQYFKFQALNPVSVRTKASPCSPLITSSPNSFTAGHLSHKIHPDSPSLIHMPSGNFFWPQQ